MGAGIVVKAVMRNSFSLVVFGGSQIVIDIQPLVVMLTNKGELHGFSHTIYQRFYWYIQPHIYRQHHAFRCNAVFAI